MNSRVMGVVNGIGIGFTAAFVISGLAGFNSSPATAGSSPGWVVAQDEMGPESESGGVPIGPAGSDAYTGEEGDNMGPRSETGGPIEDAETEGMQTESGGVHYVPGQPGSSDNMDAESEVGAAQLSPTYRTEAGDGDSGMDVPSTETGGPAAGRGGFGTSEFRTESGTPFNETDEMAPRSEVPGVEREQVGTSKQSREITEEVEQNEEAETEAANDDDSDAASAKPAQAASEAARQAREESAKTKARSVADPAGRSEKVREAEGVKTY